MHVSVLLTCETSKRPWPDEDPVEVVARVLASRRKARGYTQDELANEAGVARHIIAKIETGRRDPTLEVIGRLATALSMSPADFFSDSG